MKKYFIPILLIVMMSGCKEDLTDYLNRVDSRESANESLRKENAELEKQNDAQAKWNAAIAEMYARLELESEELAERLRILEQEGSAPSEPKLLKIEFLAADNIVLSEDLPCEIIGDSLIECWIPSLSAEKNLIPHFSFDGTLVTITVHTSEKTKSYQMYVHAFTGLPVMWINTAGGVPIVSRDYYVDAHMKLREDVRTRAAGDVLEADLQIKGRGNSSWKKWPKKPYRLKFPDKVSLLGEHKDKSWVLIANYADKSALRNHAALYLGKISNLEYTSSSHFVDLFLNGKYEGTYQVCEKMKISNHRVAVGDDGFLLEVSQRAPRTDGSIYFYVNHMTNPICVEDPDVVVGDANYNYAKAYVANADAVLYSSNFKDPDKGWKAYFDMDSFVDWYLINEMTHNTDANMKYSCFMHFKRGGKITMGPIWDFDLAFGNTDEVNRGPNGFWIKQSDWISRMFSDPAFVARVKERYAYFYSRKSDIMHEIDKTAVYLKRSAYENENRWHTFYDYVLPNYEVWGSYYNEVQSVKEWLNSRMDWLKAEFDKM